MPDVPAEAAALTRAYELDTDAERVEFLTTLPMSVLRKVADLVYVDQDTLSTRKPLAARSIVNAL